MYANDFLKQQLGQMLKQKYIELKGTSKPPLSYCSPEPRTVEVGIMDQIQMKYNFTQKKKMKHCQWIIPYPLFSQVYLSLQLS